MAPTIWSKSRLSPKLARPKITKPTKGQSHVVEHRSAFQIDHDRILFSTPVRRLGDKTQVWPLEHNDGVRNRLTHSHEVSNFARSIGTAIYNKKPNLFKGVDVHDVVQPILSAIGLAHDLGNPPFGHSGEVAIGAWFEARKDWIFTKHSKGGGSLERVVPTKLRDEFLKFDGNPQSIRLLARLQTSIANAGLDLTAATLAALLKYPVSAANYDSKNLIIKKAGYFESERSVIDWIRKETGLKEKQRHPLTWIMEACDDIAYCVLDIDDAMKKGVLSPEDALAQIADALGNSNNAIVERIERSFENVALQGIRPDIARDIKIDYLKAHLTKELVAQATDNFVRSARAIFSYKLKRPLLEDSALCKCLRDITLRCSILNPKLLRLETLGASAICDLLDYFWEAIASRKSFIDITSKRTTPITKYAFSLLSPNYVEAARLAAANKGAAGIMRYIELRLLTDMVSGMTDAFAVRLRDDFKSLA